MLSSKQYISIFILVSTFFLTGCFNADKHDPNELSKLGKGEYGASFQVTHLSATPGPVQFKSQWSIPEKNSYLMKVCLIDRVTRTSVMGHRFRVEAEEQIHQKVADDSSCLTWTEDVPFEFFVEQPKYLKFERDLVGAGIKKGRLKLEFAIDPWAKSRNGEHAEFVWLNQPDVLHKHWMIEGVEQANAYRTHAFSEGHQLLVDAVSMRIDQDKVQKEGLGLKMIMEMTPHVWLKQLSGDKKKHTFKEGTFSVSASIIGINMGPKQDQNLHMTNIGSLNATGGSNYDGDLQETQVEMVDGKLNINFPQFLLKYKTTNGNLVLALHVAADGIPQSTLKPYKVLLKLGDFNQWLGGKSPLRIQDLNKGFSQTYDEFMNSVPVDEEEVNLARKEARLKKAEAFDFGTFDIQYNSIKPGETATNRTVKYNVYVCVTHPLRNNAKAENEVFYVKTTSMKEKEITTDIHGCLGWTDEVNHYYYKPEKYLLNEISVRHSSGFKKDLKIAINPWDLFATFGQDIQKYPDVLTEIKKQNEWEKKHKDVPRKIESRFNVNNFSYTAIKFDYEIKKDLSLNVKKSVLMKIDPEVQRYSSMTYGRRGVEWLRDGIWLLKIAIHKDYLDPAQRGALISPDGKYTVKDGERISEKHSISYQKKLVRVINGRIVTPVTFEMSDLRLMRIRSNLLIQIEPIDETKLQLANWMKKVLDQRAHLDDRQRKNFDKFLSELKEFVSTHLGVDNDKLDGELEDYRFRVNPSGVDYEKVDKLYGKINDTSLSAEDLAVVKKQRQLLGEQELKAKMQYRNQRKALIDKFLQEIDAVKVREAIHTDDRDGLNDLLHKASRFERTDSDNDGIYETFPKDLTQVPADTDPNTRDSVPGRIIEGSEAKYHFFAQQGNSPIDVGLLMGINKQFHMSEVEMAELALNDFTVNPAAAFFDIEKIIEPPHVSGLRRRTFIGPVTYLLNSNGSHVRPTDTLDEVFCINNSCSANDVTEQQLREWTFPEDKTFMYKRFYNSVAHFFNRHVDDLIDCKDGGLIENPSFCGTSLAVKEVIKDGTKKYLFEGLDKLNEREVKARSLLSNFIRLQGLDFVSLEDEVLQTIRKDCEFPFYDESCLVDDVASTQISMEAFLEKLDQNDREKKGRSWVSEDDKTDYKLLKFLKGSGKPLDVLKQRLPKGIQGHVSGKQELSEFIKSVNNSRNLKASDSLMAKLCVYMGENFVSRIGKLEKDLGKKIVISGYKDNLQSELISRCMQMKQEYAKKKDGRFMILDKKLRVHKTKRFLFKGGKSMNINVGSSTGIDQKKAVEKKWGFDLTKIPVVGSFIPFISLGVGGVTAGGKSSGLSLNAGTYLVMQSATFDIEMQRFEQCLIMKYNSFFLDETLKNYTVLKFKKNAVSSLNEYGLFLCTGEVEEPRNQENPGQLNPYAVRERYYYFTQHFTEGDMLDAGDLYNHPWLLMLRGRRDFNIFMAGLNGFHSSKKLKLWDTKTPVAHVGTYTWPIENLVNIYLDVEPTFPGVYTVLENEPHDFPWGDEKAHQSFQPLNFGLGLGQYQDMVYPDPDVEVEKEYEEGIEKDKNIVEKLVGDTAS